MIMTEQKCYNNVVKFLLPLYDYNYIINDDVIEFVGAYNYCPYYPTPEWDKLFILYNILDKSKAKNITLPNQTNKDFVTINNKPMLIVMLDKPQKYSRDWNYIIESKFKEISYEGKQKILKSKINENISDLLFDTLHEFPNRRLNQSCINKEKFGLDETLNW